MRHRVAGKKLTADTQHRIALRRNLARALFLNGRIITTQAKAKAFRRYVEKLVTRAKKANTLRDTDRAGYVHQLRMLRREVPERDILSILVDQIAPLCKDRPGGYTRILRHPTNSLGDNAPRVVWEFVDRPAVEVEDDAEAEKAK